MTNIKIKKYIDSDGKSDLVDWYNKLGDVGQAKFSARMEYLCACDIESEIWKMPYCRYLDDGIFEIRFTNKKVQQRPLGFLGPNTREFTFLFPAIEKGFEFIPKDAIKRARNRKKLIQRNPRSSDEWDIIINK